MMGLFHEIGNLVKKTGDFAGDVLGRVTGSKKANEINQANNNLQQQNFENQTQIRVADALKAGINPLAALGISSGYQPVFNNASGSSDGGSAISAIGQVAGGIGRAVSSLFGEQEVESRELSLENQKLQNDYIRAQIDHLRNMNPGVTGGSYTKGVKTDRSSGPTPTVPVEGWVEGEFPGTQILHTAGGDMFVPSERAADALDIEFGVLNPYAWEYFVRDLLGRVSKYNPMRLYTNPKNYIVDLINAPYYNSSEYRKAGGEKFHF